MELQERSIYHVPELASTSLLSCRLTCMRQRGGWQMHAVFSLHPKFRCVAALLDARRSCSACLQRRHPAGSDSGPWSGPRSHCILCETVSMGRSKGCCLSLQDVLSASMYTNASCIKQNCKGQALQEHFCCGFGSDGVLSASAGKPYCISRNSSRIERQLCSLLHGEWNVPFGRSPLQSSLV